jgi:signal transduction histidine kinase
MSRMNLRQRSSPAPSGPSRVAGGSSQSEPRPAGDRFFRDLVGSMQNGVLAIRRDGRIALMNDAACRILDVRPDAAHLGRPWNVVLGPSSDMGRLLSSAFELSHLPNRAELRLRPSGKVIGYTLSHIRDSDSTLTGAVLFFKDLTRVEQLEERERLRDRLAALGEMAAAIAHEVKNPLAGIEVMAGVLRRQLAGSPDAQTVLGDIINEAKMANRIVVEVLDFVRPLRLQVEPVPLDLVLREALSAVEAQVPRHGVVVRQSISAELPAVEGDAHQLRQILINLVRNAAEAIGDVGTIEVRAALLPADDPARAECPEPARVLIDVEDDGPGVPIEVRDKIFSPFFTTKSRGSGLGLAIVRKIVDAHDGRIDMSPGTNGGTRFRVTLPVVSSAGATGGMVGNVRAHGGVPAGLSPDAPTMAAAAV